MRTFLDVHKRVFDPLRFALSLAASQPELLRRGPKLDFECLKGQQTYPVADVLAARGVPFLFATGYDENTLRENYQGHLMLRKPFQVHDLAGVIKRLLSG